MIHRLWKLWRKLHGDVFVEDYGGKADGVTDNTEAYQRAINHLMTKGGSVVFSSKGIYIMGERIKSEEKRLNGSTCTEAKFRI